MYRLFSRVKILENKWWERLVPAAAVIPAPQVGAVFIGPKAFAAGLVNLLRNRWAKLNGVQKTLLSLRPGGVRGIPGGAVKCYNPRRTTCGEGV